MTLLISICSVIGGSALGFGLYMLSRARNHIVRSAALGVARIYSRIIAGTPTVVVLMILYYVIFGSIEDISGVPVSIVGFSPDLWLICLQSSERLCRQCGQGADGSRLPRWVIPGIRLSSALFSRRA